MLIYLTYSKKEVAVGEIMKYFFKTIVSLQKEANFSALSCHAITLYTLKIRVTKYVWSSKFGNLAYKA